MLTKNDMPIDEARRHEKTRSRIRSWREAGRRTISERDVKDLLEPYGIRIPRRNAGDGPYAVKYISDEVLHKTDAGLVRLNVEASELEEVEASFCAKASALGIEGGDVLVEEMVDEGIAEWFLGFKCDPTFGPILVTGIGGIFAELMGGMEVRLVPITPEDAARAIAESQALPILQGARGRGSADIDGLAATISGLSRIYAAIHDLVPEMDINPLIVLPENKGGDIIVADGLMLL